MGFTRCKAHGLNPPHRWRSLSLRDALDCGDFSLREGRWVAILYPDQSAVDVVLLDADDRSRLESYVAGRGPLDTNHQQMQARLPAIVQPRLLTVFHERARRRLNDKVFILKASAALGTVCAACLREALRREGSNCDEDLGISGLAPRCLFPTSPWVLRALDLDEGPASYF